MILQGFCASFKQELFEARHDFRTTGSTFKLALYYSSATLGSQTTAYSATGEITGTGYVAGGKALTNIDPGLSGTTGYCDFADLSWTVASFTCRGGLIYNSTSDNRAVCVLDFGTDKSVTAGTFTVTFPAAGPTTAIIQLN